MHALLLLTLFATMALSTPAWSQQAIPFTMHDTPEAASGLDGVRLLGALDLSPLASRIDGFSELSALAWSEDDGLLYAISDNGTVFALKPVWRHGRLVDVSSGPRMALRDKQGRRLRGKRSDSEGAFALNGADGIAGNTELVIAFERRVRVQVHRPDGSFVRSVPLPAPLRDASAYRSENKGPESLTRHRHHGIVTAPEWPLRNTPREQHVLYGQDGATATFERLDESSSGLVALHAMDDGGFLVVERAHSWIALSLVVTISRLSPWLADADSTRLDKTVLARLDSSLGWHVDNFEGLAHHRDRRFFLVSDDNGSALQTPLLLYFELL